MKGCLLEVDCEKIREELLTGHEYHGGAMTS